MWNFSWNWVPLKSVSVFRFNDEIKKYEEACSLVENPDMYSDTVDWVSYYVPNHNVRIDVEKGLIVNVSCDEELLYKGQNLIGMDRDKVLKLIGHPPEAIGEKLIVGDEEQITLEFADLGLMLWVNKSGKVVSADCDDGT